MHEVTRRTVRGRPDWLRALGAREPPETIVCDDRRFRLREIYKHDSWAATARYASSDPTTYSASRSPTSPFAGIPANAAAEQALSSRQIVCKFNRQSRLGGVPMGWLGRRLARREAEAYRRLSGICGVAQGCGPIFQVDGQRIEHAVAHEYIPGEPLDPQHSLPDDFFPALRETLRAVHAAGIAYVDLHKRENVLVSSEGHPYLIDFQVSFQGPASAGETGAQPICWLLVKLQAMDRFCLAKHVRNHRPDQLERLGLERDLDPPRWLQLHRKLAAPLRGLRRRLLTRLRVRDASGRAESEVFAEHAFRRTT